MILTDDRVNEIGVTGRSAADNVPGMTSAPDVTRLRLERPGDRAAVTQVHQAAFGNHGTVVVDLLNDLRSVASVSLVAEDEGQVVGHVLCSPALLDAPRQLVQVQTLSPLGVLPAWQGLGVGSALVRAVLHRLVVLSVPVVFVEGDPGYYSRLGFTAGSELGFRRPSLRIPKSAFQAALLPAYESWMTGTFVYPDVFWRHDAVGLRDIIT